MEIHLKHSSFFSAHVNESLMLKHLLFLIRNTSYCELLFLELMLLRAIINTVKVHMTKHYFNQKSVENGEKTSAMETVHS